MSGGLIWEFQAKRKPFAMSSHPLAFINGMSQYRINYFKEHLNRQPPKIIILDGYTEQTYLPYIPEINAMMKTSYTFVDEIIGSKYPVKIYVLRDQSKASLR